MKQNNDKKIPTNDKRAPWITPAGVEALMLLDLENERLVTLYRKSPESFVP